MTKDILTIFDTLSDINRTVIYVTFTFNHYFLYISVYYSCRTRAREYVKLSFSY